MAFDNMQGLIDQTLNAFSSSLRIIEMPAGSCGHMRYPRLIPIMHFYVRRFAAPGFGSICTMQTNAMGGIMQLATIVFTPNCGGSLPLLLIDVMSMKKKKAAFIEYYDCTKNGARAAALRDVYMRYSGLPDYQEKGGWYVAERTPYSLIKGGEDIDVLFNMIIDSARAYGTEASGTAGKQTAGETQTGQNSATAANREGLSAFINRMAADGNPSSAVMSKVLGRTGAEKFFREIVMPVSYSEK